MAIGYLDDTYLTSIANAIRDRDGSSALIPLTQIPGRIVGLNVKEKDVNFYDYDGTLLYSYTLDEAHALTALPTLPSPPQNYTAHSWTETLSYVKGLNHPWNVGVNYTANNEYTSIYIKITKPETTVGMGIDSSFVVDWGTENVSVVTDTNFYFATYHAVGDYVIKVDASTSGSTYSFNTTVTYGIYSRQQPVVFDTEHPLDTSWSSYMDNQLDLIQKIELGSKYRMGTRNGCIFACLSMDTLIIPEITFEQLNPPGYLFMGSALKHITIPNGVNIAGSIFQGCSNLRSVVIPSDTTGNLNYQNCGSLQRGIVTSLMNTITGVNCGGCYCMKELIDLSNYTSLGSYNAARRLKTVEINSNVSGIGSSVFYNSGIRSIRIPSNVKTIAAQAFQGCNNLTDLVFEEGIEYIGYPQYGSYGSNQFASCRSLLETTIPNSVIAIASYAFYDCQNLKKIIIGSGVVEIQSSAFYDCKSLTEFWILAKTPPTLGNNVFNNSPIVSGVGTVYVPAGCKSAYQNDPNWGAYNIEESFEITNYKSLTLSTSATPSGWDEYCSAIATLLCDGIDHFTGETVYDQVLTEDVSCYIGTNETAAPVTKTISYTWPDSGLTATTTVTQSVKEPRTCEFTATSLATGWDVPNSSWPGDSYRLPDGSGYTSYIKQNYTPNSNSCYLEIEFSGFASFTFYVHCHATERCYVKLDSMVTSSNYDYNINQSTTTSAYATNINDRTQWLPITYSGLDTSQTHHIYIYQAFAPTNPSYGQYCASVAVDSSLLTN